MNVFGPMQRSNSVCGINLNGNARKYKNITLEIIYKWAIILLIIMINYIPISFCRYFHNTLEFSNKCNVQNPTLRSHKSNFNVHYLPRRKPVTYMLSTQRNICWLNHSSFINYASAVVDMLLIGFLTLDGMLPREYSLK